MVLSSLSKCATKALLRSINHIPVPSPATNTKACHVIFSQNCFFTSLAGKMNLSIVNSFCHTCQVNQSLWNSTKGNVSLQSLGNMRGKMYSGIICMGRYVGKNQSLWHSVKRNAHQQASRSTRVKTYNRIIYVSKYSRRTIVQRLSSFLVRPWRHKLLCVKPGMMILGSVFLTTPLLFKNTEEGKEEKPCTAKLPKEPSVKKNKGPVMDLLMAAYEVMRVWMRALRLALTFGPIILLYPITYLGKAPTEAWWSLLLIAIEFSGPILIKLGQWMSTRRDIFPEACCTQFSRLQRRIAPHSWQFTVRRMKRAFGPNWRKIFVKFDNHGKPIGSGCVAQVYKVWMNSDYIPDEQLVEEILSEMDEDNTNDSASLFEGLQVLGFHNLFDNENLEAAEEEAVTTWRVLRDTKWEKEREERRRLEQQTRQESEPEAAAPSEGTILGETDMITIVETVANELLSGEEPTVTQEYKEATEGNGATMGEEPSLSLVEEWQEGPLDKSLPIEDTPPEDLEGLVPVAIKVLHPGVISAFRRDLRILRACAWFVSSLWPPLQWLSLQECVDEFAQVMEGQINLKREADQLETFSENFSNVPHIKFPRPLRPYVTSRVLVETYEEGDNMLDVVLAPEEEVSMELRKNLAQIGVDALLKMVFLDNLVHGDLHPGNILVQNNNGKSAPDGSGNSGDVTRIMMVDVGCDTFVIDVQPDHNPLRLCILDCGVVSKLSERNLANIRAVFKQVVLGDGESVAELFLDNSIHQCSDPDAFKAEIADLVDTARTKTISLGQVDVGMLLQNVLSVLLRHRVRLESAFSAVVLAIFVLEGLGRALDPDMDILERARPVLVTGRVT